MCHCECCYRCLIGYKIKSKTHLIISEFNRCIILRLAQNQCRTSSLLHDVQQYMSAVLYYQPGRLASNGEEIIHQLLIIRSQAVAGMATSALTVNTPILKFHNIIGRVLNHSLACSPCRLPFLIIPSSKCELGLLINQSAHPMLMTIPYRIPISALMR